jgi:uncharacterized protein
MERANQLVDWFDNFERCIVAFSGGVDSAVVAKAAAIRLGDAAVAVTSQSPSVAKSELQIAEEVAKQIGIRHEVIFTRETENPAYRVNDTQRCYYCKTELYGTLASIAKQRDIPVVVSGTNHDDLGDFRPGLKAAQEKGIRHPLVELGIGKSDVRALARHWKLIVAEKPASPCLASRVAYGVEVTPERLTQIEQAEAWMRQNGFVEFRVRYHQDGIARIEVPLDQLSKLTDNSLREPLVHYFRSLGFRRVSLDLEGFFSGSLYQLR